MKALAIALAVIFFIVGILYMMGTLQFLAHQPGPHMKHAIIAWVLALLSLVWFRFQSSPQPSR
jgi:hypothetical protein